MHRSFLTMGYALCLASVLSFGLSVSAQAQTAPKFDPIAFEGALSSATSDQDRLALVENAIAVVQNAPNPDLGAYFDLNELRLELLLTLGQTEAAAEQALGLAQFADANRDVVNRDPVIYFAQAAELFEQAGNLRQALRVLDAEAGMRLDAGQTGEALAQVYENMERIAKARGDDAGAMRFTQAQDEALNPSDRATKSVGDTGYTEIEIFYATDRARTGQTDPNEFYGDGRGELEYGITTVSIPDTHQAGAIELPSIWRLEFGPKPAKHVMVRKVDPMQHDAYFEQMQARVQDNPRKEVFVFIHGFNVRFDAAARRAAQLTYDMNYSGVPVLYSWPSAGKSFQYVADTAVVRLSGRRLSHFLEELHAESGAETIHIIAHSMGNRALTDALELLALRVNAQAAEKPMFGQLFFAAPDVDADLFREMMQTIRPLASRMTLYTSENDWALVASRKLHGGQPRAGQSSDGSLLADAMFDTVDMSDLGEDMLAHSYFANDSSALLDIASLLWLDPEPGQRCGLDPLQTSDGGTAWLYVKGACLDAKLVGLISHLTNSNASSEKEIRQVVRSLVDDPDEASRLEDALVALAASR